MADKRCTAPESIECTFSEPLEWEPVVPEWEYYVTNYVVLCAAQELQDWMNSLGRDGWELIQLTTSNRDTWRRAIFKRRRRTESEQCCKCECDGQESEGVQCSQDEDS